MEVQIIGIKKSNETKKAIRFFSERRIKYHFRDLAEKGLSRGELANIARSVDPETLIDRQSALYKKRGMEFLKYILGWVLDKCAEDMDFFNQWIQKGITEKLQNVVNAQFTRMTYTEAIDHLQKASANFDFPCTWGSDLQSEHERFLTEEIIGGPVIVTDYPKQIKAFYMKLNDDQKTVRAMDILVPRLGEIIGGSERENRLPELKNRILEMELDLKEYWWYLDLRRFGSVPHSGFGLGFERLIQYVTGMQNIRDVIPFPRTVNSADF